MSKTPTLITRDQLEDMRAKLAALPPKQKTTFSSREAIAELAAEIRHARVKLGYNLTDIAALLQELGHPIQASTLRSYVREWEAAAGTKKTGSPRKGKARMPLLDLSSEVQARRAAREATPVTEADCAAHPPAPPPEGQTHVEHDTPIDLPAELPGGTPAAMEGARDG